MPGTSAARPIKEACKIVRSTEGTKTGTAMTPTRGERTISSSITEEELVLADPIRFRRALAVLSLVLAPVLMVAGVLVAPFEETKTNAAYLAAVAEDPSGAELSAVLLHFGFLLLVPCVWAMASLLRERSQVLGNLGLLAGTIGAIGNAGVVLLDFADIALVRELSNADAVAVYERLDGSWGFALSAITGIPLLAVGLLLLVVALWRARELPVWSLAILPSAVLASTVLPVGRWSPLVLFAAVGVILIHVALRLALGGTKGGRVLAV